MAKALTIMTLVLPGIAEFYYSRRSFRDISSPSASAASLYLFQGSHYSLNFVGKVKLGWDAAARVKLVEPAGKIRSDKRLVWMTH